MLGSNKSFRAFLMKNGQWWKNVQYIGGRKLSDNHILGIAEERQGCKETEFML